MAQSTKACTKCGATKPRSEFARNAAGRDGLRGECRPCRHIADRRYLLNRRFGVTPEDYDRMLAEQGGGCALCGTGTPGGRWSRFHVDHCHATGRVRGLLCYPCNYALGILGDTPDKLKRAYEYVAARSAA